MTTIRHYTRPDHDNLPDKVRHWQRTERDTAPLFSRRYPITPRVTAIDEPFYTCRLPYIPRDVRAPSAARIETLPVIGGDSITYYAGREPSRMRLVIGFDAISMRQPNITEELAFWRRITGPGPHGQGIRVRLNFGEAQDQVWYVETVEVENKERRGTDEVISAVVTADMVQAVAPALALSPAQLAREIGQYDGIVPKRAHNGHE